MSNLSRRDFLRTGVLGLAAAGTGSLILRSDAAPTPASGSKTDKVSTAAKGASPALRPTSANIQGPFYRTGAPYRAKVSPPLAPGTTLLIQGRVWSHQTKKSLPNATLDVWHASAQGRYDNDDRSQPPAPDVYLYRVRLVTDENGFYEYETIHPGRYPLDETRLRPSHIHYQISAPQHKTLITQLYFKGDTQIVGDPFVQPSLIIALKNNAVGLSSYESGIFDIVLAGRSAARN